MHPDLIAAYLRTIYRLQLASGTIELKIGELSPALDQLLSARGATRWAWLTAVNPGSQILEESDNRARLERMRDELGALGWAFFEAVAVDPDGCWPDEPSFFVLDPEAEPLRNLAKEHGQNACVAGESGGMPQLILLVRDSSP